MMIQVVMIVSGIAGQLMGDIAAFVVVALLAGTDMRHTICAWLDSTETAIRRRFARHTEDQ